MSYEKAMRHWKNHRKDKYYQQTSPLITCNVHKENFVVKTTEGDFCFDAYCYEHAKEIAIKNGLKVI